MNKSLNTINPRCYNGRVQIRYHHQDQNEDATVKYGRYKIICMKLSRGMYGNVTLSISVLFTGGSQSRLLSVILAAARPLRRQSFE